MTHADEGRWLLAAEADQIQDLVFRSAELREVVGGSQLLERFCDEAPGRILDLLLGPGAWSTDDLAINRGGAFRILFDDRDAAAGFGADLAHAYRALTGGSLSVAAPVRVGPDYRRTQKDAHDALILAKREQGRPQTSAQAPFVASCASCGRGLAVAHRARPGVDDDSADYLCADCRNKFSESKPRPIRSEAAVREPFIGPFRRAVWEVKGNLALDDPPAGDWASAIAAHDPNRMVAYLAADGNGMGKVFGMCLSKEDSRELSIKMQEAMLGALAHACVRLLTLRPQIEAVEVPHPDPGRKPRTGVMPVLPLILGGDDLFALLPAPWAVDLARVLMDAWTENLAAVLKNLDLDHQPTVSAALVFCKANYPHTLARRRCELELNKRAKRVAHDQEGASVLTYAVITGNQTGGGMPGRQERLRTSLAPFRIDGDMPQVLFDQRLKLGDLPRKRLHELEAVFDEAPARLDGRLTDARLKEDSRRRILPLLERIGRHDGDRKALEKALDVLGGSPDSGWWRVLDPPPPWLPEGIVYAHALPDLMRLWPFLHPIDPRKNSEIT